jgi:hypothetical protein
MDYYFSIYPSYNILQVKNKANDFGFADAIGNLPGITTGISFQLTENHAAKAQGLRVIVLVTIGIAVYEIIKPSIPGGILGYQLPAALTVVFTRYLIEIAPGTLNRKSDS